MSNFLDSSNLVEIVYRPGLPDLTDDPAENYFAASKINEASVRWDLPGGTALEHSTELRTMTTRAARQYTSRATVPLPPSAPLAADLSETLANRRSAASFTGGTLETSMLAGLLRQGNGVSGQFGEHALRPAPSAGALYPLDLFVVSADVSGLSEAGLYHHDPYRDVLADLGAVDLARLTRCINPSDLAETASAIIVVSATFWRSRFKYGQRSLRFAHIEAGHVAQNLLLLATAYGMAACPIGGFYDDELTTQLPDHNGVDDAPLYVLLLGTS